MSLALVFPGQGSQSVGMLAGLAADHAVVRSTFAEASQALGFDLWERVSTGPAEALNQTECTQPAMLVAGVAFKATMIGSFPVLSVLGFLVMFGGVVFAEAKTDPEVGYALSPTDVATRITPSFGLVSPSIVKRPNDWPTLCSSPRASR